jgi:hypothetical protein
MYLQKGGQGVTEHCSKGSRNCRAFKLPLTVYALTNVVVCSSQLCCNRCATLGVLHCLQSQMWVWMQLLVAAMHNTKSRSEPTKLP